mmetsp:Transcript_46317/g.106937  ORF Transcript_46317/g.106937 Transcript_46317/m.106937 type:complete len:301 (+) Transcript_46317:69-971(+)|eukprot:CAMPEP_0171099704 /NCGR_PEP_ID=MMETSP0766_2-20121228/52342_1 /TAXON_ID=439317 /ORGANISM="Gambierdiscus australes, Strain CAWD 149" /LENGTH=300 /DNA_ID=CAMNT_0011559389 /DNA_START=48 /DNA_END=950 /DNA_ORIENTATION=+
MRALCTAVLFLSVAAHDDAVALLQLAQPPVASETGPGQLLPNGAVEPAISSDVVEPSPPTAAATEEQPNSSATTLVRRSNETTAQAWNDDFQVGDYAYVRLAEGPLAGKVLPCMIKGKKLSGKYHIRVFSAPLSQDLPQIGASYLSKLKPELAVEAMKNFQADQDAQLLMKQLIHEVGLRARNEWVARGLNTTEVQRKLKAIRNKMIQDVEIEAKLAGCPAGFHLRKGTSRAIDRLGSATLTDVIADCKLACVNAEGCHSFQWSPNLKECILIKASGPKWERGYKDFLYCAEHVNRTSSH